MSTLKITKIPTNLKAKKVSQKATDQSLKITKIGGWKGHSPSPSKKENHAGGITEDTDPLELCPEINGFNDLPIDQLSLDDIPNENLIRYRVGPNKQLRCYDVRSLKRIVDTQHTPKDPTTGILFDNELITMIRNHPAQYSSEIKESIELGRQQRRDEADRSFRETQQQIPQQQPPRPFDQNISNPRQQPTVDLEMERQHRIDQDRFIEEQRRQLRQYERLVNPRLRTQLQQRQQHQIPEWRQREQKREEERKQTIPYLLQEPTRLSQLTEQALRREPSTQQERLVQLIHQQRRIQQQIGELANLGGVQRGLTLDQELQLIQLGGQHQRLERRIRQLGLQIQQQQPPVNLQ